MSKFDNIMPMPPMHKINSATAPKTFPPERALMPEQAQLALKQAEIGAKIAAMAGAGQPVPVMVLGERPVVQKLTAEVFMTKMTAKQLFPHLVFAEGEDHAIITEVMRPAKPGDAIVCVHGASGQKFAVDHYELNGDRV